MHIPKTNNPLLNEDITADKVFKLMFQPLVALDERQKPVPFLAESFTFAEEGTSVDIVLKAGVLWWDGEPVTADDAAYSLNVLRTAPETAVYKACFQDVGTVSVIDEYTLRINYTRRVGYDPYRLCFPIIPRHYYSDRNTSPYIPMGNGPYKLETYSNIREMVLSRNDSYATPPFIDSVRIITISGAETEMLAFSHGIIDEMVTTMSEWGKYTGTKQAEVTTYVNTTFDFIGFNFNNRALSDLQVRKAVAHAVNRRLIEDSVFLNHAAPALTTISPASWLYEPVTASYPYNPETARALLTNAGYELNAEGVMFKQDGGLALSFKILVNEENTERVKIAAILKENFAEAGIQCEITALPFEEYEKRLKEKNFDLMVGGFRLAPAPDPSFAFHSSGINEGGNYFSYRSDIMDALLSSLPTISDEDNFIKAYSEYQKLFAGDLPCIGLVFRESAVLTDTRIYGEKRPAINNEFYNIHEWFIWE
jgi:peptide/nickel transport system substrate-binding protein